MPGPFGRAGSLWRSKKTTETAAATPRSTKGETASVAPPACTIALGRAQYPPLYEESLPEHSEYCGPPPEALPGESALFRQMSPKFGRRRSDRRSPRDAGVTSLGRLSSLPSDRFGEESDVTPQVLRMVLPDVPACFLCPISQQLMTDPVIGPDGSTYERQAIEARDLDAAQELRPNVVLKAAIDGYVELRQAAQQQWDQFEESMSDYKRQVGQRVECGERQIAELRKQLEAIEAGGGRGAKLSARSAKSAVSPEATLSAVGSVPKLMLARDEGSPCTGASPCPFSAGPAPRSARGPRPSPRPTQTPRTCATPRKPGISSLSGLKASLTPRISQMIATPRSHRV
mmetsp:Transcript_114456/g.319837  ORF Transcript_114456/g.319837 Transcript_114456/m.319837 type:complete len:344 (+) Transcript_114456:103-1134(+)